jgi:hypothetical protein
MEPSYDLLPATSVYQALAELRKKGTPIAIIRSMAVSEDFLRGAAIPKLKPALLRELFDSKEEMSRQPYVLAGKLLHVPIE